MVKKLRRNFERFCFQHRNKGIPNLMLYLSLGTAVTFFFSVYANNMLLYEWLCFDRELILKGQVWRLFSYVLLNYNGGILFTLIALLCYYSLGRAMENLWGTLRFNLFYLTGVLMMDVFCMIFGGQADASYLNMSLFLAYATLFPETHFLLFFIVPIKAWVFAVFDLALTVYSVLELTLLGAFPFSLFPLVAIANYFLFFGSDIKYVFPLSWRANAARLFRKKPKKTATQSKTGTVPFPTAGSYRATTAQVKQPYHHKCTTCGRTDVSHPELEFRYCSRCKGYHCYCEEHISNHEHITE